MASPPLRARFPSRSESVSPPSKPSLAGAGWMRRATVKQVLNPANGQLIGTVPNCGAKEAREAIEAADKALPDWRSRTAKERAQLLRKWFDLIMANPEDLAVLR